MLLLDSFRFVADNRELLAESALRQLALSAASLGIAIVVAMPIGIITGHLHRFSSVVVSAANVGYALPTLAIIAILVTAVGIGFTNIMLALVVLALPPVLINSYVAIDRVDRTVIEAVRAAGMRPHQVLLHAELPYAIPLIFTGIRIGLLFTLASAYLATFAGHPGTLGDVIADQSKFGLAGVLGATIVVLLLAFTCDGLLAIVQRVLTPKGVRLTRTATSRVDAHSGSRLAGRLQARRTRGGAVDV